MALIPRISTAFYYDRSIGDIAKQQVTLAKLQRQITSERDAASFSELGDRTVRTLDLEEEIIRTDRYIVNNNLVISRLREMDIALADIQQVATNIANEISRKRSPSGNVIDLVPYADAMLGRMQDALNAEQAGRYLFAGSQTNQPPIQEANLSSSNIISGVLTDSYYSGDNYIFTTQASDSLEVEYGITAGNDTFKKIFAAINLMKDAEAEPDLSGDQDAILVQSLDYINEAISELAGLRNQLGNDSLSLEASVSIQSRLKDQLSSVLTDTVGTDVVQASIKISESEAVLQAIFQNFARISQLSLNDFLS